MQHNRQYISNSIQYIFICILFLFGKINALAQEKKTYTIVYDKNSPLFESEIAPLLVSKRVKDNDYGKIDADNYVVSPYMASYLSSILAISDNNSVEKIKVRNDISNITELGSLRISYFPNVPTLTEFDSYKAENILIKDDRDKSFKFLNRRTGELKTRDESTYFEIESANTINAIQFQITQDQTFIDSLKAIRDKLPLKPWGFKETNFYIFDEDSLINNDSSNYLYASNIELQNTKSDSTLVLKFSASFLKKLEKLEESQFKNFYIVDFFSASFDCETRKDTLKHGAKVISVVENILERTGLLNITKSKIFKIPINFFDHKESCLNRLSKLLDNPLSTNDNSQKSAINLARESLAIIMKNKRGESTTIPKPYYELLFNTICNKNTDIISASISLQTNSTSIPDIANPTYNFIVSGFNSTADIDLFLHTTPDADETVTTFYLYPQEAIIQKYYSQGGVIVGGVDLSNNNIGTYGSKVTTHGNALGWSKENSCLATKEQGLSFSTPQIASYLFIAKAYWRKYFNESELNSLEVRKRLVASSTIVPALENKSQASGIPNLEILCNIPEPFLIDSNGVIKKIIIQKENKKLPSLILNSPALGSTRHLLIGDSIVGKKIDNITITDAIVALQIINSSYYICFNKSNNDFYWEKISDANLVQDIIGKVLINNKEYSFTDLIKQKISYISFINKNLKI